MIQYDQEILKDLLRQYHELDDKYMNEMQDYIGCPVSLHFGALSLGYRNAAMMLIETMQKLGIDQ